MVENGDQNLNGNLKGNTHLYILYRKILFFPIVIGDYKTFEEVEVPVPWGKISGELSLTFFFLN